MENPKPNDRHNTRLAVMWALAPESYQYNEWVEARKPLQAHKISWTNNPTKTKQPILEKIMSMRSMFSQAINWELPHGC